MTGRTRVLAASWLGATVLAGSSCSTDLSLVSRRAQVRPAQACAPRALFRPAGEVPAVVLPSATSGLRGGAYFAITRAPRCERDFVDEPEVVTRMSVRVPVGTRYRIGVTPKVFVVGQRDVKVRVNLARRGRDFKFDPRTGDTFGFTAQAPGEVELPLREVRAEGRFLVGTVKEVTETMLGYKELHLRLEGRDCPAVAFAVRVVPKIRLALTFDDGPSVQRFRCLGRDGSGRKNRTPTEAVLDVLREQGIKAAFFVLTTPDTFGLWTHPKADTEQGFKLLRREVREGHLVCLHWGGTYGRQSRLHTSRLHRPAYDFDDDGVVDKVTEKGNALESDLLECMGRVKQAYEAEGFSSHAPEFVRPPVWKFRKGSRDARPTYDSLGLKMILTDAKLADGGYPWAGFILESWLIGDIRNALRRGTSDIVLTMHDSNPETAVELKMVLKRVRRSMANIGLVEGRHWKFVDSTEEMRSILRERTRWAVGSDDSIMTAMREGPPVSHR